MTHMRGMMNVSDLSHISSSVLRLRNGKVVRQTVDIPGAVPTADDGVSTDKGEMNATVGVRAVTRLTKQPEISSKERIKGLGEGTSASQGRVGLLWKGKEEEELWRLVSIHTGPKGTISWVKIEEAWNQIGDLPERSKSSLSSNWRDLKSRPHLLGPANAQGGSRAEALISEKVVPVPTSPVDSPPSTATVDIQATKTKTKKKLYKRQTTRTPPRSRNEQSSTIDTHTVHNVNININTNNNNNNIFNINILNSNIPNSNIFINNGNDGESDDNPEEGERDHDRE